MFVVSENGGIRYTPKICGHIKKDDGEPLTSGFREFYHVLPAFSGAT